MSSQGKIILTSNPKGVFLEGVMNGTPKPGIMMQLDAGVEPVAGRHTWEPFNGAADGEQYLVAILIENWALGKTPDTAYVDGERCFMYCPIAGEEMQVLLQNQSGTADSFAIGDKLIVDDGTGKFLATTGSPESEPFIVMETLAALTADQLVQAIYTGH